MNEDPALAYVGVGSNIDPEANLASALESLTSKPGVTLTGISTIYRTAPLGDPTRATLLPEDGPPEPDPDFLNGVLEIRTFLTPENLMMLFAGIENALGRKRPANRYAPRTMDLDLLLFGRAREGGVAMDWEEIGPDGVLAHNDILRRGFVAHPLFELAPDLILPPHNIPLVALAGTFETPGGKPEEDLTVQLRRRFLSK